MALYVAILIIPGLLLFGFMNPTTASATAGIEQELSFEGKIVNSSGTNIVDGNYNMEFKIYTGCTNEPISNTGCTAVWTEDYLTSNSTYSNTTPVTFTSSTFQVDLGSICSFSGGSCEGNTNSAVNWNSYPLYLSLNVGTTANCSTGFSACGGGDGAMSPYVLMTSTPYSFDSSELGGISASGFIQTSPSASQTIQPTANATGLIVQQNSGGTYGSDIFDVQGTGGSSDDFLQVTGSAANNGNVVIQGLGSSSTVGMQAGSGGTITIGNQTASTANTIDIGSTTTNANADAVYINTAGANTGTVTIGGTGAATGTITVGQSTGNNTVDIAYGATASSDTQTVNIATQGASSSTTNVTIGSAQSGDTTKLQAGAVTESLTNSGDTVKTSTNSSTAFEIQNASNANLMDIDTSGGNVNLGLGGTPPPLGYTTVGGTADTGFNGSIHADRFIASYTGTISSISVYIGAGGLQSSPDNSYQVAIYANNSGVPGSYIASSSISTLSGSAGWNTASISASLTAGTTYWLAYETNSTVSSDNTESYNSVSGAGIYYGSATWNCTSSCTNGLPTTFPAGTATSGYQHSIYATYSTTAYAVTLSSSGVLQATGSATFEDAGNSTTAFQVQTAVGTNVFDIDTLDKDVIIGVGSAGETTPSLLVLDSDTSSTDPTGVAGAMYYNSSLGAFRCYQNGAWTNCIGLGPDSERQTAFYNDDFYQANTFAGTGPWACAAISSGTFAATSGIANHPGVDIAESSTTASSGYACGTSTTAITLSGGETFEIDFEPLTFTNTTFRLGFLGSFTAASPSNYSAFIVSTSGTASCQNDNAGTLTTAGSSYTLTASNMYRAKLVVNSSATSVSCYIYNMSGTALLSTTAGGLPTAAVGSGFSDTNSGTTATNLADIDYMAQWYTGVSLTR